IVKLDVRRDSVMTTLTKLPYDEKYITEYSEKHNEPAWMKEFRLEALEVANNLELPKPDKTNIRRWNFTEFKHHADGERSEEHTSELQSRFDLVCRLLLEKKKNTEK